MNAYFKKKYFMNYTPSGLPSDYQEVEYIESTGSQYIDSGIINKYPIKVNVELLMPTIENMNIAVGTNTYSYGSTSGATYYGFPVQLNNSKFRLIGYGAGTIVTNTTSLNANTRYSVESQIKSGDNYISVNGVKVSNSDTRVATSFGNATLPLLSDGAKARVYSLKIELDNVLVRNYIPCYRKSDYKVGLYDLVNGEFKTDENGGNFLMGRPIVCDKISGYQQVDYLQSTGNGEYVLTHTPLSYKTNITLDYEFVESGNYVIGANLSSDTNFMYVLGYGFVGRNTSWATSSFTDSLARRVVRSNANTWTKDGTTFATTTSMSATPTSTYKLCLFGFADNNNYTSGTTSKIKLYWAMKEDDNREILIPMRDTSSGQLGLYDLVSGAFLSSQGESFSLCGADIIKVDGYRQVEYIGGNSAYIEFPYETNGSTIGFDISFYTPSLSLSGDTPLIQNDHWNNWVPIGLTLTANNKSYFGSYSTNAPIYWTNETYTYNEDRYQINYLNSNSINSVGKATWTHSITKDLSGVSITKWTIMSANVPSTYHLNFLTMTDGTSVIARFIPMECQDENKQVGLYDTIGGTFYPSQASNFLKGNYIGTQI